MDKSYNSDLTHLIKDELLVALGCTEPIAVAYASAKARDLLDKNPERVIVRASRDIIKNVHSVKIPNGGDLVGVDSAALLGIFGGNSNLGMKVLENCDDTAVNTARRYLGTDFIKVEHIKTTSDLQIVVELFAGEESSSIEVSHTHMNITKMMKNGEVIFSAADDYVDHESSHWSALNFNNLYDFAINSNYEDLTEVWEIIETQKNLNHAIAKEGVNNDWGNRVGKAVLSTAKSPRSLAIGWAAAGSDARMAGCTSPVVINSGSGNSGITVSVPVLVYGTATGKSDEAINRAILLSNLVSLYIKHSVGRLSAYCGAVASATGSGCALTYLEHGDKVEVEKTLINSLGNTSGMICDGAKGSCAAKISSSLHAAFLGHKMAMAGDCFHNNDGITKDNADDTIAAIGILAKQGMEKTDDVILEIMLDHC